MTTANKQTRVFLSVRRVARRGYEKQRVLGVATFRHAAEWICRGASSGHVVYKSKACDTEAEAVRLACAWLDRQNAPVSRMSGGLMVGHGPRFLDTTEQPERFDFSAVGTRK
jgi:hypothetical protein